MGIALQSVNDREGDREALASAPLRTPSPRIVMVNDEVCVLQTFDLLIRQWFQDATVLMCNNGPDALEELSKADPDLLITDDKMAGMDGQELCRRLFHLKVKYPIIVDSPWEPTGQWVRELASRGLNVSMLLLPCAASDLRKLIETSLKARTQSGEAQQPNEPKETNLT